MSMEELYKHTARQMVELLRTRQVSPLEAIDAAVARIEATDRNLNAIPTLCMERARKHARKLMAQPSVDAGRGQLHGLPIAVKDLVDVAGVRSTRGSPIYADRVPDESSYSVGILEGNGAVVIGKSNTPEFGAGANTFNEVFGKTRNPWDTRMTCGGSSGGSAVALASGQVWLATGSDLGGSLRIPASFCSVVGLRPSPGRVPEGPKPFPFETLSVDGPMGRTVGDVALMLDAEAGHHPGDPLSYPAPETPYVEAVDNPAPPARIAYTPDLGIAPVAGEVNDLCAKAVKLLEGMSEVEEDTIDLHDARETFQALRAAQFAAGMRPLLETHRDQLKPEVIWNIEKGMALDRRDVEKAQAARGALFHSVAAFFEKYDLLVCPTVSVPPFDVNIRYLTEVDGVQMDNYVDWLLLTFALTLTACPAISVPCGFTESGLPVGLQLVGPPRGEVSLLSAAALFEEAAGLAAKVPIDPVVRH